MTGTSAGQGCDAVGEAPETGIRILGDMNTLLERSQNGRFLRRRSGLKSRQSEPLRVVGRDRVAQRRIVLGGPTGDD